MIGWLSGQVVARESRRAAVTLNVGGVGYEVRVSLQTMGSIPAEGERCTLWIHTHVREEALALYGFLTPDERELFLLLLGVPKVGPKHAMAVLGGLPIDELLRSIAGGEQRRLEKIPGIGRKTAEQILLSLKDKVLAFLSGDDEAPEPSAAAGPDALVDEANAVLVALGWRPKPVEKALAAVIGGDAWKASPGSLDELVRRALAELMER
ncbi:MAG: Holliday junction branch migration protein RuvA [Myxococcales bacterium]|nr:Holliday junction branch migration protein RuvA [Myxococcales bacterium]